MSKVRTRLLVSLLLLLAANTEASPQTAQSAPPASQVVSRQTRKSGNSRSSPATGAIPGALPGLCFQPGVGWQRIPLEAPGVPAKLGTHASTGLEASGSTSVANPQSIDAQSSSAKPARSSGCAGIATNQKALIAGVGKSTILNHPGSIRSAGLTKPGTVPSLQVNSPHHAKGSADLGMTPSAMPPASTYSGSEAEPDARADQVGDRAFHAYISSIKLRRLIRNTPDFRTRIKLQQLENNPATQSHKAGVGTQAGAAARRPLKGERASRTPSRRSDTRDQPRDNPRKNISGADR
jgi:hypothetical protein